MARRRINDWLELESTGFQAVLMSAPLRAAVDSAATRVASNVRSHPSVGQYDLDVIRDSYTSNDRNGPRVAASVTLAGWAGKAVEGRDGVLTQAASSLGGTVRN